MANSSLKEIFVLFLAISFLSCSKKNDVAFEPIDRTAEVFEKVSNQNYAMDTSQFKMTGPNSFTLRFDSLITIQQNVRANCVIQMSGASNFLESGLSEFKYRALFELANATVISAKPFSTATNDPMLVCTHFVEALKKKMHFEQKVYDLTTEYISFAKLDFSMPSSDLMEYIYSDTNHTRVSDFGIRHNNELREYFFKDGASVDLTSISLAETSGLFRMNNSRYVSLQLLVDKDGLTFSSSNCNFKYNFRVERIYTDSKGFWFELKSVDQTPSNVDSSDCKMWDENISSLPFRRIEWGYAVGESMYNKIAIFIRFPSQKPGVDRVETFFP